MFHHIECERNQQRTVAWCWRLQQYLGMPRILTASSDVCELPQLATMVCLIKVPGSLSSQEANYNSIRNVYLSSL